jgi:hypothetical protein
MKNLLSHHTDLCEWVTSLLLRGIQMGEMSKLGWLIGLVKYAIWADPLYFLHLLLLSISKILPLSQPTLVLRDPTEYVSPPSPEDGNRTSFRNILFYNL